MITSQSERGDGGQERQRTEEDHAETLSRHTWIYLEQPARQDQHNNDILYWKTIRLSWNLINRYEFLHGWIHRTEVLNKSTDFRVNGDSSVDFKMKRASFFTLNIQTHLQIQIHIQIRTSAPSTTIQMDKSSFETVSDRYEQLNLALI